MRFPGRVGHGFLLAGIGLVLACANVPKPTVRVGKPTIDSAERAVQPAHETTVHLEFRRPVLWINGPRELASQGVALPKGPYPLEAEDSSYLYFRAPGKISLRRIQDGEAAGGETRDGGVALAKAPFNPIQAVVYVDLRTGVKQQALLLGASFLELEGRDWTREE